MLQDGFTWVVSPPGEGGLAFSLADEGFDVWIANTRGTRPSRGHKLLDANLDPVSPSVSQPFMILLQPFHIQFQQQENYATLQSFYHHFPDQDLFISIFLL